MVLELLECFSLLSRVPTSQYSTFQTHAYQGLQVSLLLSVCDAEPIRCISSQLCLTDIRKTLSLMLRHYFSPGKYIFCSLEQILAEFASAFEPIPSTQFFPLCLSTLSLYQYFLKGGAKSPLNFGTKTQISELFRPVIYLIRPSCLV